MTAALQTLLPLLAPAAVMSVLAALGAFAFTTVPITHRPMRQIGAAGTGLTSLYFVTPWDANIAIFGVIILGYFVVFSLIFVAYARLRRTYINDHETHFCAHCGQLQTPLEPPALCPECGSRTFFRMPPNADNMDRTLALSENPEIVAMQRAIRRATRPRALLLAALLLPVALLCLWAGRRANHAGFWILITAMWTITAFAGSYFVTIGVGVPPDADPG